MGKHRSKQRLKRAKFTEASSPPPSKRQRREKLVELQSEQRERESPLLLPSSDSLEKSDVPSASGANSDPSTSSTSVIGNNYYVFLSFRGLDTRNGFVDHLYHRLKAVGLKLHPNFVFRDDEDLPFGEKIDEKLITAIERSKVSIPIISKNYAASEWCLHELIHIMECKESRGQKVLPVLYKVKPKHVRHLKGSFGKAFEYCKDKFEEEVKQQGPVALRKAVGLRVFESEKFADGREGELVNELVEIILRELQHDFQPHLPANLVAIEDRVAEVMELVDLACPDTRIIGIWGMGGIGKTTLATIIYKKLFGNFQCHSSLKDIRETTKRKGMEHVQSLLLSDLRKDSERTVRDPEAGINMIRLSCPTKKVLILLDDVDHQDQLNNLIGGCNFESGSRIIITCRDNALLKSEYKSYELKVMNSKDSMLLFTLYAFEAKQPPTNFTILSSDIVATTGGLPLALEIIGSFLKGKDKSIWIETLESLRKVPDTNVQEKLKISYNALQHNERQMFLDIACFFIGYDKRSATYLWKDLQLRPDSGLARMIELSLIKYDDDNKLRMHDQLRDLGRAIAHPEGMQPWLCSRLWGEEAMKVLRRKEESENIEALRLDERGSREFMECHKFKRIPNLKLLHLSVIGFAGDFEGSLSELRWLKWERCRDSFEATNFHLEKLVILDLSDGDIIGNCISENWRGWSSIKMERLKVLNLSWCFNLRSTPNLSSFKNLEMLILEHCARLKEIDPSIRDVKCLLSLNLGYCKMLQKLPEQLGEVQNLEELVIDETLIKEIPPCVGSLKKLKTLSARCCWRLTEVPSSIISLVSLSLADCYKLQRIPSSIGKLSGMVELDLSYTGIKKLPESIGELNKLKILRICHSQIERLPSSIGRLQSLQVLDAYRCCDLEGQIHVNKGGLSSLKTLRLGEAKISGLPENLDQLYSLEHLDLLDCSELRSLPKPPFRLSSLQLTCRSNELPLLSHLKHLKELTLRCCMYLQSIPELPFCIQKLLVRACPKLDRLPNLSNLKFLSELELIECNGLKKLDGLEPLKSLRRSDLSREPELSNFNDFDEKTDNLHAIQGLEKLRSLEVLDISGCKHIQVLDLSKSEHLKRLVVRYCESLVEIRCHSKYLEYFDQDGCKSLKKLPEFLPHGRP